MTFQSTLPRRERLLIDNDVLNSIWHFNPRSREGSDVQLMSVCPIVSNFNPRSREGSDWSVPCSDDMTR